MLFNLDGVRSPWSSVQRAGDLTLDEAMCAGASITDRELMDGLVYDGHFGTVVDAMPLQTYMDEVFPNQDIVPWVQLPGGN